MPVIRHFAYGSNMLEARLRERCSSASPIGVAVAPDWKFSFSKRSDDGSAKATISRAKGNRVLGILFELDERDLETLDGFEGRGKGYDRTDAFLVQTKDGTEPVRAMTYIASKSHVSEDLQPYDWYQQLVLAGAREHSLPQSYVDEIAATEAMSDPWPNRPNRLKALALLSRSSN